MNNKKLQARTKKLQDLLDRADYWARVTWRQLQPIHLHETSYREYSRMNPFLTENELNDYHERIKHYAPRQAHFAAWDALHLSLK